MTESGHRPIFLPATNQVRAGDQS